jgi:glutamate synthase domain-containing protein 2
MGGPLADGGIENGYVHCPFHGWEYDLFTGKATHRFEGEDVDAYEVKIENGFVKVSLTPKTADEILKYEDAKPMGYLEKWARGYDEDEGKFYAMQQIIQTRKSEISPMRTLKTFPGWESILFKGAQLSPQPFNEEEPVSTKTIIGKTAEVPLEIEVPFYVSHMSYGALSREAKIALAKGSSIIGTVMCSGEGGMLPDERENANKYIYELGTASFSHKDDAVKSADGVEIKIGQAAKPGLGGHLPKEKITEEIAQIRGISPDEDSISPARHVGINSIKDLKDEVTRLREITMGKPIGIKFSAGHIEKDLDVALQAEPDFITIDCRGGATGAAPTHIKDNVCVPPVFAIYRARKYLDRNESKVTLCVTGSFRDAADVAKGIAVGADAVALATASLIAIGCQQYRTCHTGNCPVGITTQNPVLRKRFDIEKSVERFVGFYSTLKDELENFVRINGRRNVHELNLSDILTINHEIAQYTDIQHA